MLMNKVSPATLCRQDDHIMNSSELLEIEGTSTQYSQYSQASLELFSQPFQFENTKNATNFYTTINSNKGQTDILKRDKEMIDLGRNKKSLSKYYMKYISSQSSEGNNSTQESGYHSYQSWNKENCEINEKNRVIEEVVKVTKECKQQIEASVIDVKESLKLDLQKQSLLYQEQQTLGVSNEQTKQLHELLKSASFSTKEELNDMNRKLNECNARFDVLELQLRNHITSSENRFNQLCSLIESLRNELTTSLNDCSCSGIPKLKLPSLSPPPPSLPPHCSRSVLPHVTDNGFSSDDSPPHIDISLYSTNTNTANTTATNTTNTLNTLTNTATNTATNTTSTLIGDNYTGPITRTKRKNHQSTTTTINNKENEVPKPNTTTANTTNTQKRFRSSCNEINRKRPTVNKISSSSNTIGNDVIITVEDSPFLTSPPVIPILQQQQSKGFQRRSEMQRRQAFIKTMAPGSDGLLKEIQSVIGRGVK